MSKGALLLVRLASSKRGRSITSTVLWGAVSIVVVFLMMPVILIAIPALLLQAGSTGSVALEKAVVAQQQIAQIENFCKTAVLNNLDFWLEQTLDTLREEGIRHISVQKPEAELLRIKVAEVIILWSAEHGDKEPDGRIHEIIAAFLEKSIERYSIPLEDGSREEHARIIIRIRRIEDVLLMRGLTAEQENVAQIMLAYHRSSNQVQSSGVWLGNDQSFQAGDIIFDEGVWPLRYYHQRDERWANQSYAAESMAVAGCGPTAVAMVVSSLLDQEITPDQVARWSEANGYAAYNNGSYLSLIPSAAQHYGLSVSSGNDPNMLKRALTEGKLAIVIMGPGAFTPSGHYIVLRGLDAVGNILVADPISVERSELSWSLEQIVSEARQGSGSGGPIWIFTKE